MARSTYRVLKRSRRVILVEAPNPVLGIGYSVRNGSLGLWSGNNLAEAEQNFEQAVKDQQGAEA